jgi:hypothetical protein
MRAAAEVDAFNRGAAVRLAMLPEGAVTSTSQQRALLLGAPGPGPIMSLAATQVGPQLQSGGWGAGSGSLLGRGPLPFEGLLERVLRR